MLSISLTGAALIRKREHGTIEHRLVMPLTPFEIMTAQVWVMGLVVVAMASLIFVVQGVMEVPTEGSIALFVPGMTLNLFATTSMGNFLGTMARSMPQMGLLALMILLPLQMQPGGFTPWESMAEQVQRLMPATPAAHFGALARAILYRGAGFGIVFPEFLALIAIGWA